MTKGSNSRNNRRLAAKPGAAKPALAPANANQPDNIDIGTCTDIEKMRSAAMHLFTRMQVMTQEAANQSGIITDLRTENSMAAQRIATLEAQLRAPRPKK